MPIAEVPAFVIRETAGRQRTVTLIGRALPYRPLTLESEQRVKVTNPAGNPEGFGTVMGPQFGETQIDGFWKDKYIGTGAAEQPPIMLATPRGANSQAQTAMTGTQVGSVQEAVQLFESIVADGQLLEVNWGWVIRRGYLKKFSPKIHNIHDVEWNATFAWVSRAVSTSIMAFGPPAGRLDTARGLRGLLERIARITDVPQSMAREYMDLYRNQLAQIYNGVLAIEESAVGLISEVSPASESARIQSFLGGIAAAATNIADTTMDAGWATLFETPRSVLPFSGSLFPSTTGDRWEAYYQHVLDSIDPVQVLEAQLYTRDTISDARRMRDEAEARRRAMEAGPGYTLGIYIAREGDDLRDVSMRYYSTPDQWRSLMVYNGLTTTELYAGQSITVPRLDPSTSEDL